MIALARRRPAVDVDTRMLAALVAGRGLYRVSVLAAAMLLIGAWGSQAFSPYAAAMGTYAFVLPVIASGIEKSALTLLPRASAGQPALIGSFLAVAAGLCALFSAGLLGAGAAGASIGSIGFAVGGLAVLLAVNQMLVGLHRALGRPLRDLANFVALSVATVAATLPALIAGSGVLDYVVTLAACVTALNVALLAALGRWSRPCRADLVRTARTVTLMGVADVAGGVTTAALFVILAASAVAEQTTSFYVTMTVAALVFGIVEYVLRVVQPQVSLALARDAANARRRVRRLGTAIVAGGLSYVALVVGSAIAVADVTPPPSGSWPWAPAVTLLVLCLPVFFATAILNYVLENLDARSLRLTATGSAAGVVGAVGAGLLTIPRWGAFGAVAALTMGEIVHAAAVQGRSSATGRRLTSRRGRVRGRRSLEFPGGG